MADKIQQISQKMGANNQGLRERVTAENWKISYDRKADMIFMGAGFPKETFYVPVDEKGFMVRVDKDFKIYGFAIENAKAFVRETPELQPLNYVIRPIRSLFSLLLLVTSIRALKGLQNIRDNLVRPLLPEYYSRFC